MVFIVIDGTDGSGKATQSDLLIARITSMGRKVARFDFPRYGKPSASMVEAYLNGSFGDARAVSPKVASIFFAIDRFAAKEDMLQARAEGKVLVSNRYVSSNMGHQAGKIADPVERKAFFAWLDDLEYSTFGIPRPDLTLFLDVPPLIGQTLVDKKGSRDYVGGKRRDIHESDLEHLENAYQAFIELSKGPGWIRVQCVKDDALLAIEEVGEKIWTEVRGLLR